MEETLADEVELKQEERESTISSLSSVSQVPDAVRRHFRSDATIMSDNLVPTTMFQARNASALGIGASHSKIVNMIGDQLIVVEQSE